MSLALPFLCHQQRIVQLQDGSLLPAVLLLLLLHSTTQDRALLDQSLSLVSEPQLSHNCELAVHPRPHQHA